MEEPKRAVEEVLKAKEQQVRKAKNLLKQASEALDHGDLVRASEWCRQALHTIEGKT